MITSKLTSRAQTTIPLAVRSALGIGPGDELAYTLAEGQVVLAKSVRPKPAHEPIGDHPFAAFSEWNCPEDDAAFRDL